MSWPTTEANRLIDAMTIAEGGRVAMLRAVRISFPNTSDYDAARAIALNTVSHALCDFVLRLNCDFAGQGLETADASRFEDFVKFLGEGDDVRPGWAPVPKPGEPPIANDPHGLNKNWVGNVLAAYKERRKP